MDEPTLRSQIEKLPPETRRAMLRAAEHTGVPLDDPEHFRATQAFLKDLEREYELD